MHVNPVARFIFWSLVLLLASSVVFASDEFRLNKPAVAGISVCLTQADAEAILTTERDEGKAKADEKFIASEGCANVPVEFTPKRIVAVVKTARGMGRVVEILSGEKLAYWITYQSLGFRGV